MAGKAFADILRIAGAALALAFASYGCWGKTGSRGKPSLDSGGASAAGAEEVFSTGGVGKSGSGMGSVESAGAAGSGTSVAGAAGATSEGGAGAGPEPCTGPVEFPDPVLEAAVREELGIPTGALDGSAVATLERLGVGESTTAEIGGVASLEGLQCAVRLAAARFGAGSISSLAPLAKLSALAVIQVNDNQVTDISPLRNLPNLWSVHLRHNQITSLDGTELDSPGPDTLCPLVDLVGNPFAEGAFEAGVEVLCEKGWDVGWISPTDNSLLNCTSFGFAICSTD